MRGILMGNWSIENIIACVYEDNSKSFNKEYTGLLEMINSKALIKNVLK